MKARTTRGFFNKTNAARTKKTEKAFRSLGYQILRKSENQKKKERKERRKLKKERMQKSKKSRRVLLLTLL
jgi:hypothetical protein